jgi:hypothetical protein
MKSWKLTVSVVAVLIAGVVGVRFLMGQDGEQEPQRLNRVLTKELGELMRRKLESSQKVLEGIALSDFDRIAKHADDLIAVSKQAEWQVLKTPQYESYSNDLRRSAEVMIQQSREKNLDGVVLAYVDMTLTCVKCHKHVREAR